MKHYWLLLLTSIVLEVAGTTVLKLSQTSWPLTGMIIMYVLLGFSYFFLARAVIKIPIGVAYAFWEGLGLVFITVVSFFFAGRAFKPYPPAGPGPGYGRHAVGASRHLPGCKQ